MKNSFAPLLSLLAIALAATPAGAKGTGAAAPSSGICAPDDLFGSYTITYNNGQPFSDPLNKNAQIVKNVSFDLYDGTGEPNNSPFPSTNIAILEQYDCFSLFGLVTPDPNMCTTEIEERELAELGVGINPTGIGTTTGDVGSEDGEFGPCGTSFTWNYNVPDEVFEYGSAGMVMSASITETGPGEVTYERTHVRNDFSGVTRPTAADMVTDAFILQRN